jgi:hypothetical protein
MHDACAFLISEIGLELSARSTARLIHDLNHRSVGEAVTGKLAKHPAKNSIETVLDEIRKGHLENWFIEQLELARRDVLSRRAAWTWRPVPSTSWGVIHE